MHFGSYVKMYKLKRELNFSQIYKRLGSQVNNQGIPCFKVQSNLVQFFQLGYHWKGHRHFTLMQIVCISIAWRWATLLSSLLFHATMFILVVHNHNPSKLNVSYLPSWTVEWPHLDLQAPAGSPASMSGKKSTRAWNGLMYEGEEPKEPENTQNTQPSLPDPWIFFEK